MNKEKRKLLTFIIAIFCVKFIINAFFIAKTSIWYDEAFSIFHSQKSIKGINTVCMWDFTSPFYYYCLHFWMKIFGTNQFSARLLSSFFNALSTGFLFGFLYTKTNKTTAIFSLFLFTSSNLFFLYAQETRTYSLIILLYIASSWLYYNLREQPNWKLMILLGAVNYAIVLSHYIAGLIIFFQVILLLYSFSKKRTFYYIGSLLITAGLLNKWIYRALEIFTSGGNGLAHTLSSQILFTNTLQLFNNNIWVFILEMLIIVAGSISIVIQQKHRNRSIAFNFIYFLLLGLGSFLVLAGLSLKTPMFISRYLLPAHLGIILLIAYLFSFIKLPQTIKIGLGILPVVLLFGSINYSPNHGMDYKNAVNYVKAEESDSTMIILQTIDIQSLFAYYYNRSIFKEYDHLKEKLREEDIFSANDSTMLTNLMFDFDDYNQIILVQTYEKYTDPNKTLLSLLNCRFEKTQYTDQFKGVKITTYLNNHNQKGQQDVPKLSHYQYKINYYIRRIKNDKKWRSTVQQKADLKGISLDSMIYLDAIYMANQN